MNSIFQLLMWQRGIKAIATINTRKGSKEKLTGFQSMHFGANHGQTFRFQ